MGPGRPKCEQATKPVKKAVAEAGVDTNIEKMTNIMEIVGYGIFGTPAMGIDGNVKIVGKIPKKEDIKAWISE